jgi:NADPH-dependent 2,4-dienoyl-CoA reductase/sulfur reductase-like enzyme
VEGIQTSEGARLRARGLGGVMRKADLVLVAAGVQPKAGENAVGGDRGFEDPVGTQLGKVLDLVVARTGLRDSEARAAGFEPLTVESEEWDHKGLQPGSRRLRIRATVDPSLAGRADARPLTGRNSRATPSKSGYAWLCSACAGTQ